MTPVTINVNLTGAVMPTYHNVHVLTSVDDLMDYQGVQDNRVRGDFKKFLSSKSKDHEQYGAEVASLFVPQHYDDALDMLSKLDRRVRQSTLDKLSKIHAGRHVVVNRHGGWFDLDPEAYEIVAANPDHFMENVRLIPCTAVIALENDPMLDPFYASYGEPVSSVLNLRTLTQDQVTKALNLFHDQGGDEVLVYTQANQIEEVKVYLNGFKQSRMDTMTVVMAVPKAERPEAVALFEKYGALVLGG